MMLKPVLFYILLIPACVFAQQEDDFFTDIKSIADAEKKIAEGFFQAKVQSLSSNNFDVHHYRCEWEIDPTVRYIKGAITSDFTVTATTDNISFDLSNVLTVDSVLYHGNKISFQKITGDGLKIQFPSVINAGVKDSVSIFYQGVPPPVQGIQGLHRLTNSVGKPLLWTLSQPYGAKDWWPCKDGLTDKADSVDIIITHPSIYAASSNGVIINKQTSGSSTITHFKHRYPIVTYLVAIAVSDYTTRTSTVPVNGKDVLYIRNHFNHSGVVNDQEINYVKFTIQAMKLFGDILGNYPFENEHYAETLISGFNGGQEHQTNSFLGNYFPNVRVHELAHQWFGDATTCGSWRDIWLNEGITTYVSAIYLERFYPSSYRNFMNGARTSVLSKPDGSVYVTDTTSISRIFDGRLSYNKGALVMHMLRWVVGADSIFYKGLRTYFNDPVIKHGFSRTADLQRNFEKVSGKNLNSFFQKWVKGEGYPTYHIKWTQNRNNWVRVKIEQTTSHPSVSFYDMPLQLQFRSSTQGTTFVVDHKYNGQEFDINLGFPADTIVIDPGLWILSKSNTSEKIPSNTNNVDEVKILSNPSPNNVSISLKNPTGNKITIQLFMPNGQLVFNKQYTTPGSNELFTIPMSGISRGVYILRIKNNTGSLNVIKKVIH